MDAYMQWVWLGVLILFAVAEACTSALVSLWFVGGSLAALLIAIFGLPLWLQLLSFVAVSAALLFALRPLAKKYVNSRTVATNMESNVGKVVPVIEAIDNLHAKGAVKVSGVLWSAFSNDGKPIEVNAPVRIVRVAGARLCVEPADRI